MKYSFIIIPLFVFLLSYFLYFSLETSSVLAQHLKLIFPDDSSITVIQYKNAHVCGICSQYDFLLKKHLVLQLINEEIYEVEFLYKNQSNFGYFTKKNLNFISRFGNEPFEILFNDSTNKFFTAELHNPPQFQENEELNHNEVYVQFIENNPQLFGEDTLMDSFSQAIPSFVNGDKINFSNEIETHSAIYFASKAVFKKWLVSLNNFKKGRAYGKFNLLNPDNTEREFEFKGDVVFRSEATFRITLDEGNNDTYTTPVYYYSKCFNPIQNSKGVSYNNVSFISDDETINDRLITLPIEKITKETKTILSNNYIKYVESKIPKSSFTNSEISFVSSSNIVTDSDLRYAISYSLQKIYERSSIIFSILNYKAGVLSGKVKVYQRNGVFTIYDYEEVSVYEVRINVDKQIYLNYLLKSDFNLIIPYSDQEVIFRDIHSDFRTKVIYDNSFFSPFLSENHHSKVKIVSENQTFIKENLKMVESNESFWNRVSENNEPKFVDPVHVFNTSASAEAAIVLASERAFKSLFIGVDNIRLGRALGKLEIFYPNGKSTILEFKGEDVYEAIARFRLTNEQKADEPFISIAVYYASMCFNPIRSSSGVDNSNVTFIPYATQEKVKINTIYTDEMQENIKTKKVFLNKDVAFSVNQETKIFSILDISGSMYSVLPQARLEVNKIPNLNERNKIEFDGIYFYPVSDNRKSITSNLIYIINQYKTNENFLIYIYSDFQDFVDMGAVDYLMNLVRDKNIKIYLRSLELSPTKRLIDLANLSKGDIIVDKRK